MLVQIENILNKMGTRMAIEREGVKILWSLYCTRLINDLMNAKELKWKKKVH